MSRFGHLLGKKASGPLPDIAVCLFALGNPGREYAWTRHNIGWLALDRWIERQHYRVRWEEKGPVHLAAVQRSAETCLLVKPTTFMNRSGAAYTWIQRHYRPGRTLILHDEMDCPYGRFKFAASGGAGGHNGLRSLIAESGNGNFHRFKIGIGHRGEEVGADFVLSPFLGEEREKLDAVLDDAAGWIELYVERGLDVATQELQRKQRGREKPPTPKPDLTTDPSTGARDTPDPPSS